MRKDGMICMCLVNELWPALRVNEPWNDAFESGGKMVCIVLFIIIFIF